MKHTITTLTFLLLLISCDNISNNGSDVPPIDDLLSGQTTKLTYTSPKPFSWIDASSNKKLPDPKYIDIEKLPKEPLKLLDFKPFKSPVVSTDFDFEKLPSDYFSIDSLPVETS
jgi:hypothetical protein